MLDSGNEEPKAKLRRYVISAVVFVALLIWGVWFYGFRFNKEKQFVADFLNTVQAGDFQGAYKIWNPPASTSYTFQDFQDDWGPSGFYGPLKSYRVESASTLPHGGSGTVVVVDVSPYSPYPTSREPEKQQRSKVVRLWVDHGVKSLSFAPEVLGR